MRVAPASNQPQQQQQQQPAAPAVPALGLKSIRGGTMAGKSMGGASARGSVPGMGTWSARSAAGTLSGGQGGSSSGGGYGGAAAEAEEDEESSLAAMLTVGALTWPNADRKWLSHGLCIMLVVGHEEGHALSKSVARGAQHLAHGGTNAAIPRPPAGTSIRGIN
jgi:hypothetical protein